MGKATQSARSTATTLGESRAVELGARAGYVASGIMHLLMGWLALQLAWGTGKDSADQSGAFGTLADSTWGKVLLGVMVAGLVLLAVWQATEAIRMHELKKRLKPAAKAVTYLVIAFTAGGFLWSQGSSSKEQTRDTTKTLLGMPGGTILVGLVGLVVIGVGVYHVLKGAQKKFHEDLVEDPGQVAEWAAMLGYILKGLAFLTIGGLLLTAAAKHDPSSSTGLDGAFRTLLGWPAGPWIVTAIGLGFAAYGVYSFFRARFARV